MTYATIRRAGGYGLILVGGICLLIVMAGLSWSTGPATIRVSKVQGFRLIETASKGTVLYAFARLPDGRVITLPLPTGVHCKVGSTLLVREYPRYFGVAFIADPMGCATR